SSLKSSLKTELFETKSSGKQAGKTPPFYPEPAIVDYIAFHLYLQVKIAPTILFCLCRQYLFLYRLRNRLVSVKEHGVVTTALSSGTQVCCITEHLSQRNETADHLTAADIVHTFDTSTTGVDITDNITHVVFRCGNFDLHDRLKQYRCGFLHSFLERQRTSDVECHLRRVDLMIRTIVYVCMNAYYRESAKDTSSHSLFDTLADCRDILLRNSTADNGR